MADDRRSALRDRLGGSGRHHTDALVNVLPPGIPGELARRKALREHGRVVKAFQTARADVTRLHEEYVRTAVADEAAIRQAARDGKPAPAQRAPEVGQVLEAAEREARVLADELKMATGDLIAGACGRAEGRRDLAVRLPGSGRAVEPVPDRPAP